MTTNSFKNHHKNVWKHSTSDDLIFLKMSRYITKSYSRYLKHNSFWRKVLCNRCNSTKLQVIGSSLLKSVSFWIYIVWNIINSSFIFRLLFFCKEEVVFIVSLWVLDANISEHKVADQETIGDILPL